MTSKGSCMAPEELFDHFAAANAEGDVFDFVDGFVAFAGELDDLFVLGFKMLAEEDVGLIVAEASEVIEAFHVGGGRGGRWRP